MVLPFLGIEYLSYTYGYGDLSTIQFDIGYIQKAIALVGQNDVREGVVFFIEYMIDEPIVSDAGRGSLSLISDSLILILNFMAYLGEGKQATIKVLC
jgi:hypothetical protein